MVGPQNGVGFCPTNVPIYKYVCPFWELVPYEAPLSFSDYWKNPRNKEEYLKKSRWLAELNNEREGSRNAQYAERMRGLRKYILVEALKDRMVLPHVSEQHGYSKWNEAIGGQKETLEETEAYKGDWLGLKTLNKSGRLHRLTFNGDHMDWGDAFWEQQILPQLGPDPPALPLR